MMSGSRPHPDEHDPATMPVAELERIGHERLERAMAAAPSKHDQLNAAHARLLELEAERDAWRSFAERAVFTALQDADRFGGAFDEYRGEFYRLCARRYRS